MFSSHATRGSSAAPLPRTRPRRKSATPWPGRWATKNHPPRGRLKAQQVSRIFSRRLKQQFVLGSSIFSSTWEQSTKKIDLFRLEQIRPISLVYNSYKIYAYPFCPARRLVAVTAPAPATRRRHNVTVGDPTTGVVSDCISCSCCFASKSWSKGTDLVQICSTKILKFS